MSNVKQKDRNQESSISRRKFLKGVGTGAVAATVHPTALVKAEPSEEIQANGEIRRAEITLMINGHVYSVEIEPRTTLLSVLRDGFDTRGKRFNLTGAKLICDRGECGGCTVQVDGKPIYSCMILAIDAQNKNITTVEGLATGDRLNPVQEAFVEHDALMCGFCTPGFIVASQSLLDENPKPTLKEIKLALSGNICRCGTYPFIFEAVQTASRKMGG